MCSCTLAPLYIIIIRINRWVPLEPQMTKRFILIWFYRIFFFYSFPARIQELRSLQQQLFCLTVFLFFGTNPYRHRLYGKKSCPYPNFVCILITYRHVGTFILHTKFILHLIKNHVLTQKMSGSFYFTIILYFRIPTKTYLLFFKPIYIYECRL